MSHRIEYFQFLVVSLLGLLLILAGGCSQDETVVGPDQTAMISSGRTVTTAGHVSCGDTITGRISLDEDLDCSSYVGNNWAVRLLGGPLWS